MFQVSISKFAARKKAVIATAVAVATLGAGTFGLVTANDASASAAACTPTGSSIDSPMGRYQKVTCTNWATAFTMRDASNASPIGHMRKGRNWVLCAVQNGNENPQPRGYKNNVWLYTLDDTNQWSYMPATFISEGNDYQVPGNVPMCGGGGAPAPAPAPVAAAPAPAPAPASSGRIPQGCFSADHRGKYYPEYPGPLVNCPAGWDAGQPAAPVQPRPQTQTQPAAQAQPVPAPAAQPTRVTFTRNSCKSDVQFEVTVSTTSAGVKSITVQPKGRGAYWLKGFVRSDGGARTITTGGTSSGGSLVNPLFTAVQLSGNSPYVKIAIQNGDRETLCDSYITNI